MTNSVKNNLLFSLMKFVAPESGRTFEATLLGVINILQRQANTLLKNKKNRLHEAAFDGVSYRLETTNFFI